MAKRKYFTPILLDLLPEDPSIVTGGSQGTVGEDTMYEFEDAALKAKIGGYDYYDLEDMDTDFDGLITWAEYNAWAGE